MRWRQGIGAEVSWFLILVKETLAELANMVISCNRMTLRLFWTWKVRKLDFQGFQQTTDGASSVRCWKYLLHTSPFLPCLSCRPLLAGAVTFVCPSFTSPPYHLILSLTAYYTLQCTLHTRPYTLQCTLHTTHSTLYMAYCQLDTSQSTQHIAHCILHTTDKILHNAHCSLYAAHYNLQT